jgi:phosphofructokinase-like protein
MAADVIGSVVAYETFQEGSMRVAMLTGGGDCPGLNAVIRAVARKGERVYGDELVGFLDGWKGVLERRTVPITVESMRGTLPRGGTVLGSSRTNPYKEEGGAEAARATLADLGIDALIAIGGEDTLGVAHRLASEGVQVLGVPKTIDNDLSGTDLTFGFDTAVQICVDAIDRLHTTAESHDRVMVVEVMGRHAGHIAAWSGIAGGATITLIPEQPFDVEAVCEAIRHRHTEGKRLASIVVVSEGATPKEGTMELQTGEVDAFGHVRLGGIGARLAEQIEERTGYETRVSTLGHIQRGGTPTAFDRVLATRFGVAAIDAVHDGAWGTMVALQGTAIVRVPLAEAVGELKLVDPQLYDVAQVFFE